MTALPWYVWFIAGGLLLPPAFIGAICLYEYLVERYGRAAHWTLWAIGLGVQTAITLAIMDRLTRWWESS